MSDADARPSKFVLKARYTRIECPERDYEGLWAEVRTNLSHEERREFLEGSDAIRQRILDYRDTRMETATQLDAAVSEAKTAKARAAATSKRSTFIDEQDSALARFGQERLALIAPFIRDWNVADTEGNDVPPPAESGVEAFEFTDDVIVAWLQTEIERGYRGGKGVRTRLAVSASTPEPMSGPQLVPETALSS